MEFTTNNAIYTFYLSKQKIELKGLGLDRCTKVNDYLFYSDARSTLDVYSRDNRTILIFGDCVNVVDGKSNHLAEHIFNSITGVESLVEYERNLGGRYVIFYWEDENVYALCDATSSVPLFYLHTFDYCVCASNYSFIANEHKLSPNRELLHIKKASPNGAALPFDVTFYSEIKQLLPNHYFHWRRRTGRTQRFVNIPEIEDNVSAIKAAKKTLPMIMTLARFYGQKYSLCCPITGGRDSRVVLSVLNSIYGSSSIPCYTIKHKRHSDTSGDIVVPQTLIKTLGNVYTLISDKEILKEVREQFDLVFGKGMYSVQTLTNAYTVALYCGERVPVDGDIIGQVGKSSLFRDLPETTATVSIFLAKLHNFSNLSHKFVKLWLEDVKTSKEKVSSFDLFCLEQRMGSWAAQKHLIYNLLGQRIVNIFNSRNIIYEWTKVNRKERILSLIHKELIGLTDSRALSVPYAKDSKLERLIKSNRLLFYLGTMAKFYWQKWNFIIRSK